jgi:tetraacyldisaccharide 4'-kinase
LSIKVLAIFLKILLMPFSILYGLLTSFRNLLYDNRILKSYQSNIKTIVIGNLQVGGTGKSPHTAMLYHYFSKHFKVGILSRGYGRASKGLIVADHNATPQSIGDEPMMYFQQFKNAQIVVSESRKNGLKYFEKQATELVLLDDAFQHRKIQADVNIVLTDYHFPYYKDFLMPSGRLRESLKGMKRADIVVVSKCPNDLSLKEAQQMLNNLKFRNQSCVFFTSLLYETLEPLFGENKFKSEDFNKIIALSGIANSSSFIKHLETLGLPVVSINKNDHYVYRVNDVKQIVDEMGSKDVIITTEKDAVKLREDDLKSILPRDRVFVLPVKPSFLFDKESDFYRIILDKIQK